MTLTFLAWLACGAPRNPRSRRARAMYRLLRLTPEAVEQIIRNVEYKQARRQEG